ncbi:ester cyclase family protein [Micromonospora sp. NPDC049230]|uniref:ester cyclase n=1 Tax=Micromonospora sp. NPDC049230 TaxID=3155502 RepID=UPI0033FAA34D
MIPTQDPPLSGGDAGTTAALVERLFREVYNGQAFDLAEQLFADDYVNHQPGAAPGISGLRQWASTMLTMFPDLTGTIEHMVVQNDRAMVFVAWHGHMAGTGKELNSQTANLYRVRDGRIAEHWSVFDYSALVPFGITPPDQEQPASEPDWTASPAEQENLRLVLRVWEEVMQKQNLEYADEHYRADYIQHNRFAAQSGGGLAGMKQFFAGLFVAAPDLTGTIDHILVQDDFVALFSRWRGREATSGRELKLHTADLLRIEDGRIAEHWDVFDYSAVSQFGIIPPPR